MPPYYPTFTYLLTLGAASVATGHATPRGVDKVRLASTVDAHIKFGASPTAAASDSFLLLAECPEVFTIHTGDKVAAIPQTGTVGVVTVTELD